MEVDLQAVREVLDGVETALKKALRETVYGTYYAQNNPTHIESALKSVQDANTELLKVR